MYHFEEAHKEEYGRADPSPDFASYFTLAKENDQNLGFWTNAILEHKEKADCRGRILDGEAVRKRRQGSSNDLFYRGSESAMAEDTEDSHLEDSDYEGPVRMKRPRSSTVKANSLIERAATSRSLVASSPPPCMTDPPRTPPPSTCASSTTPRASWSQAGFIKAEPSDDDDSNILAEEDLVEIFVGPANSRFQCSRANLAQSAILSDRITTRDGRQQPFVMDPSFADINPADFTAVVQFLNAHEYEPILLRSADGKHVLDDSTVPVDAATSLIRSAHLFNLAKRFQLPALAALIFRKILHGHGGRYDPAAFLTFASDVLAYRDADFPDNAAEDNDDDGGAFAIRGLVEDWIIKFLAENMQHLLSGDDRGVAVAFWALIGSVKGVEARVMAKRLEFCTLYPGGRIKIED